MIFAWSLHLETEDKKEIVLFLCLGFVSFSICLWPLPGHVNHSSRKTESSRTLPVSFLSSPSPPFSHPLPHPSRILPAPVSFPHLRLPPFPSSPPKPMKSMHLGEREQFRRTSAFPSYTEPSRAGSQLAGWFGRQDVIGSFSALGLEGDKLKECELIFKVCHSFSLGIMPFPPVLQVGFLLHGSKKKKMTFVLVRLRHALERQSPDLFRVER